MPWASWLLLHNHSLDKSHTWESSVNFLLLAGLSLGSCVIDIIKILRSPVDKGKTLEAHLLGTQAFVKGALRSS